MMLFIKQWDHKVNVFWKKTMDYDQSLSWSVISANIPVYIMHVLTKNEKVDSIPLGMLFNKHTVNIFFSMEKETTSLWDKIMRRQPKEKKGTTLGSSCLTFGNAYGMNHAYETQPSMSYHSNVVSYRAVTLICQAISHVKIIVIDKDGQEIHHHPAQAILANPQGSESTQNSLFESIGTHLLNTGNCFIQAFKPTFKPGGLESGKSQSLLGLQVLKSDRVRIMTDEKGYPNEYHYMINGSKKATIPIDANSSILHIKRFHPSDDYRGLSPMEVATPLIKLQNQIVAHNSALLRNAGRPSGALMVRDPLSKERRDRLLHDLSVMASSGRTGAMLLLEGAGFEWKEMGLTPMEMGFDRLYDILAIAIGHIFGVAPIFIDTVRSDKNSKAYEEARLYLWEDTVLPLLELILAHLTSFLQKFIGDGWSFSYNENTIPALATKHHQKIEQVLNSKVATIGELRSMLGLPPTNMDHLFANYAVEQGMIKESRPQKASNHEEM